MEHNTLDGEIGAPEEAVDKPVFVSGSAAWPLIETKEIAIAKMKVSALQVFMIRYPQIK